MTLNSPLVTTILFTFLALRTVNCNVNSPYYGIRIGKFSTHFHDVKGDVYAVDDKTLFIKGFSYDGRAPDAFFWAGTSVRPDASGFVIPDDKGSSDGLASYQNQDLVLRLPVGKEITQIRWLSVWSKSLNVNFGSLIFPKNIQPPRPAVIGPLQSTSHGVSSGAITILDTQTFLVPDFTYDGSGKNVFWWISRGLKPNTGGIRLRDENGSDSPLKPYSKKTVVISIPDGHSIYDYETLSVWSDHDIKDYGFVKLRRDAVVPPSPRALGISLENKLNCEMLNDDNGFEVRWVISGDQLIVQLVSRIGSHEYMAFGLSSDDAETKFISSDATVAWLEPNGKGNVVDYFVMSADKCDDARGMCPDSIYEGASNSVTLMNAARVNNYAMITFRRPLKAADKKYDQHVYTDGPQAVLWAIGEVSENGEVKTPRLRTRGNLLLDFGRDPMWNCPSPGNDMSVPMPMAMPLNSNNVVLREQSAPHVNCPTDLSFRAQLGPADHKGPTEDSSKRIWYINGLPSPILTVQRGQTYTFLVEGGTSPPLHHPLYITSSEEGGLYQKVLDRKEHEEVVFAGVSQDPATGGLLPTAEGRLCEWSSASTREESGLVTSSYGFENLPVELSCGPGIAGKLEWHPDSNTSDAVYYQSFTGKNMGGTIRVVDWCEETDPDGYLIETGKKPETDSGTHKPESELEREGESIETGETHQNENTEVVSPFYGEFQQMQDQEIIPEDGQSEEFRFPGEEVVEERIMNLQRRSQEKKKIDDFAKKGAKETASDKVDSEETLYLQDDPETVDILRLKLNKNGDDPNIQRKVFTDTHNEPNEAIKPHYRPLHLGGEPPSSKPPPNFNVHFEGGFVPLIRNPSKEREPADFIAPFPFNQRGGPQRPFPFDANESVPFHGTFKPGVPDFSGFNISHYTQAPDIAAPNHAPEQYQGLHSVPKPHLIQRPLKPGMNHPQELFIRPQRPFARPAMFGYGQRPQLFQHQPNQHVLAQLPLKHRPDVFAPGSEDLDEGSSQRVQVALQNPGSEKFPLDDAPPHSADAKVVHGSAADKIIASAPPIQRRPDFVEEEDVGLHATQNRPSYNNYQPQRLPNNDGLQNSGQQNLVPHLRPQRPPLPFPFRRPLPVNHRPLINLPRFPLGRPQFVKRPNSIGLPQSFSHSPVHTLFHPQFVSNRPQLPQRVPEESISEEVMRIPSEKVNPIPSLEIFDDNYPKDDVIPPPARDNFGQPIRNRPQLIPASSPSKFPPQIFLHRPLNINEDLGPFIISKPNHMLEEANNDEKSNSQVQSADQKSTLKPAHVIPPQSEKNEDELEIEESQASVIKVNSSPEDIEEFLESSPSFPTESLSVDREISDAQSVLGHSLNPEHTFEDYDEAPSPFDVTRGDYVPVDSNREEFPDSQSDEDSEVNVIENEANQPSIHRPDEHLGEDISQLDDKVEYGTRLQFPSREPEENKDQDKRLPLGSNRPGFFAVRRQPQFSSVSSTDEPPLVTKDPLQRVKITVPPSSPPKLNGWPGRKNILPSDGIEGHRMTETIPSKRLEEIQLPQVSQRPAGHDNGTDYSILTHVLSLIGGSPKPMEIIEPRTAT